MSLKHHRIASKLYAMAANRLFAQEAPKIFVPPVARCDFRQGKSVRSSLCLSRLEGGGGHDYPIMYGPAVRRKRSWSSWRWAVLHQCIRPLIGARCLRAIMEISAPAISLADRPQRAIRVTSVRKRWEDHSSISSHPLADLGGKRGLYQLGLLIFH